MNWVYRTVWSVLSIDAHTFMTQTQTLYGFWLQINCKFVMKLSSIERIYYIMPLSHGVYFSFSVSFSYYFSQWLYDILCQFQLIPVFNFNMNWRVKCWIGIVQWLFVISLFSMINMHAWRWVKPLQMKPHAFIDDTFVNDQMVVCNSILNARTHTNTTISLDWLKWNGFLCQKHIYWNWKRDFFYASFIHSNEGTQPIQHLEINVCDIQLIWIRLLRIVQ